MELTVTLKDSDEPDLVAEALRQAAEIPVHLLSGAILKFFQEARENAAKGLANGAVIEAVAVVDNLVREQTLFAPGSVETLAARTTALDQADTFLKQLNLGGEYQKNVTAARDGVRTARPLESGGDQKFKLRTWSLR